MAEDSREDARIVTDHFSRKEIVQEMSGRVGDGLNRWEDRIVEKYFKNQNSQQAFCRGNSDTIAQVMFIKI